MAAYKIVAPDPESSIDQAMGRRPIDLAGMSAAEKIGEAIRRSLPMLPADVREEIAALLTLEMRQAKSLGQAICLVRTQLPATITWIKMDCPPREIFR